MRGTQRDFSSYGDRARKNARQEARGAIAEGQEVLLEVLPASPFAAERRTPFFAPRTNAPREYRPGASLREDQKEQRWPPREPPCVNNSGY